jgi:hypothetical protein
MPNQQINLEKDKLWRKRLLDWQQSGLGVTEFCRRKDIKLSSFCDWRRRIQMRDSEMRKNAARLSVKVFSKRPVLTSDNFVPVSLKESHLSNTSAEPALEIRLLSGITVSVREMCSATLLANAIKVLENHNV